ncbi:MAG: thioredoxin family protein [PVC group bacterium]
MNKYVVAGIAFVLVMTLTGEAAAREWETNYETAVALAKSTGKYMLLDFTGSDWCGWCVKLKKEVFDKFEFKRFARESLVCVELDFPKTRKLPRQLREQNDQLEKKYGVKGFPTVIILSPDGRTVARTGYREGGAKKYVEYLQGVIAADKKR